MIRPIVRFVLAAVVASVIAAASLVPATAAPRGPGVWLDGTGLIGWAMAGQPFPDQAAYEATITGSYR